MHLFTNFDVEILLSFMDVKKLFSIHLNYVSFATARILLTED